jgi:DNA-binding XRE family transcriptional regulator
MPSNTKDQLSLLSSLSQTTAAQLIGIKRETLKSSDAPRREDGTYDARELVKWALARERANATDDPLLTGGDSPNLERYRKAKAELAEMDAAERRGQIVSVDELCDWWQLEIAPQFRRTIEEIGRTWPEATSKLIAAIENASQKVGDRRPDDLSGEPE